MQEQEALKPLPEPQRKDVFQALVEAQDGGLSVDESRQQIGTRFGLTQGQVKRIEREGLDHDWPPL